MLCNPQQLAIDRSADVYVTNYSGNSIVEYSSGGCVLAVMTPDPAVLHRPSGIAIAYFAKPVGSGNVVLTASKTIAGTGTTLASAQFGQIAVDAQGNLFVDLFKSICVYGPGAKPSDAPIAAVTLPAGASGTGLAISPAP